MQQMKTAQGLRRFSSGRERGAVWAGEVRDNWVNARRTYFPVAFSFAFVSRVQEKKKKKTLCLKSSAAPFFVDVLCSSSRKLTHSLADIWPSHLHYRHPQRFVLDALGRTPLIESRICFGYFIVIEQHSNSSRCIRQTGAPTQNLRPLLIASVGTSNWNYYRLKCFHLNQAKHSNKWRQSCKGRKLMSPLLTSHSDWEAV